MSYLIIPNIQVQRANALSTSWSISTCPIFAVTMFCHALGKETGEMPDGVLVVHHNSQLLVENVANKYGNNFYPHQYRGATYIDKKDYASGVSLSSQPTCAFHWSVSIIMHFEDDMPSHSKIDAFLKERHLAGGLIVKHDKIQVLDSDDISQIRKYVGAGHIVKDASILLNTKNRVRSMVELMGDTQNNRKWLMPAVMGYALLTTPSKKDNVRNECFHAYSEPLVGLVEYCSIKDQTNQELKECLWHYKWLADDVFVVSH